MNNSVVYILYCIVNSDSASLKINRILKEQKAYYRL
jgi:hypothetical protein